MKKLLVLVVLGMLLSACGRGSGFEFAHGIDRLLGGHVEKGMQRTYDITKEAGEDANFNGNK